MDIKTADLCDRFSDQLEIGEPVFGSYGGRECFGGPAATVKVFEDNTLVRQALEEQGEGRVLVVDGGGSKRCALVGDQLALLGQKNAWAGIIVYGCIRDSAEIASLDLGVKALGCHPLKSVKRNEGQRDIALSFAGMRITPGNMVYADRDGVIVSEGPLL